MLGNLATLVVTSLVSIGTFFSPSPKIISPIPQAHPIIRHNKIHAVITKIPAKVAVLPSPTETPTPTVLPTETPTPTVLPTSLPSQIPTATPTPLITETPTPTLTPSAPVDIEALFTDHANHSSVDKELLKRIAQCESGMNSSAENGQYGGMYQFSEGSWRSTRSTMGMDTDPSLRFNPGESIRTAAFKLSTGGRSAWPNCG
jgi:hypothetical protein